MKILFIGDIVGQKAVETLCERLPSLRDRHGADCVVANGENMNLSGPVPHHGFGMTGSQVDALFEAGVDVITSGNHSWDGDEYSDVLMRERVLRPLNTPERWYGHGHASLVVDGTQLNVVNVSDESSIPESSSAHDALNALSLAEGVILVDYHGDLVNRKLGFAFAVDGSVSAVVGTHTHEPTVLAHILPKGTGFVAEVGMTGPLGGVLGSSPDYFVAAEVGVEPAARPGSGLATGDIVLGAVLIEIGADGGTVDISRVGWSGLHEMAIH